MSDLTRPALDWLRQHHATISSDALVASGISLDQREHLVEAGLLVRLLDGAYGFAGAPQDELTRCAAVCTSRRHLVVAGPTAGRLWGVRRAPRDGLIHVIAPPASQPCRERWLRPYRTATLDDDEIVHRRDGIRLTCPSRTVVDLTRYEQDAELRSSIEHAIALQLVTPASLLRTAERLATPGRPWVRRFLCVLGCRPLGGAAESELELRLVDALVRRGVPDLERQVWADLPGFGRVRFDAAVPSIRWVVEVDGHPDHDSSSGNARDKRRDRSARADRWLTERVTRGDVEDRLSSTVEALFASVERRRLDVEALRRADRWP